ncbi:MAG: GUN4 domain-containing protein [Synechococcales bacterium]|nr:GUN4 domain-containing protein [Synechococcales bacterium]
MENSKATLVEQAKRGNAKAIATLLNHKLQAKGITAKASIKDSCLHIMLEAAKMPAQQPLIDFFRKSFSNFTVDGCCTVKVYGRRTGEEIPDWVEEIKFEQNPRILAQQGDIKAITALLNQKTQPIGILAKVSLKGTSLQVMLEAARVPDQHQMVSLLRSEIQRLEIQGVSSLRLYGKQSEDDFPDWQEEISLPMSTGYPSETQMARSNPESSLKLSKSVDGIELSNQLYLALQSTCYTHLAYKVELEEDKTIHELVEDFVDGLESDLKSDLSKLANQVNTIIESFGLEFDSAKIQSIVSNVVEFNFSEVRLAIRNLERVTREVLQTDFPEETNFLKAIFSGATQEITANLCGVTTMTKEAMIGTAIGTFLAPGIGSVVGGAIGGWFGSNQQKKALEALVEKYQNAREQLFQAWEAVLQVIYTELSSYIATIAPVKLLTYQVIDQAVDYYSKANDYLEEEAIQKALDLYDKAIQLNPGFALAWNNKGYALNQLEKYEEALLVLTETIQLNSSLVVAFNNYGDALQGLSRNEEALSAYEKSIELEVDNYEAWWGKGICLLNLQQYQEATKAAQKLVDLDVEHFLGWYLKAWCQLLVGNDQKALDNLKEAVRLDPDASQRLVKDNSDFDQLRDDDRLKELMESSVGISYASLKEYLRQKQWHEADQETARLIQAVIEKVTGSTEVNGDALEVFPCTDLCTIDSLWQTGSGGQFGFSVQREVYQQSNGDRNTFGSKTGWRLKGSDDSWSWRSNSDFIYSSESAPRGHLPSSLWAGEDGWFENRRDRLVSLFNRMNICSVATTDNS